MRIAVLSDIHGNDIALEAVLADIRVAGGVEAYWVLGDLVAIGFAPSRVLELLTQLPNARFVSGNTDRYVCTSARPSPTINEVLSDNGLMAQLIENERDFAWTLGAITVTGWQDWLANLPLEFHDTLSDGTQVLCVHVAPNKGDGVGIRATSGAQELDLLVSDSRAGLICVGHTHRPFILRHAGKVILNPGSISNPMETDIRSSYAVINADAQGYQVEHRRVAYDHKAVIEIVHRIGHPAAEFIAKHQRGEIT